MSSIREDDSEKNYWDALTSYAESILSDLDILSKDEYERKDGQVRERAHEEVDGSQWVIYTYLNHKVMDYTKNPDAIFDIMTEVSGECWSEVVQKFAYCAMLEDLMGEIQELVEALPEELEDSEEGLSRAHKILSEEV